MTERHPTRFSRPRLSPGHRLRNLNRFAGFTPLAYLDWVRRGSTEDWRRLYQLCRDPEVARAVAAVLPLRDPDLLPSAQLWKFFLKDLRPEQRASGV